MYIFFEFCIHWDLSINSSRACQLGEYARPRSDSEVNVGPKWQKSLQNRTHTIVRYYTRTRYIHILVCNGTIFMLLRILKFGVSGKKPGPTWYILIRIDADPVQNSPCDPCAVHCCMHWCALCQEHREMKGRLSDESITPMTIVNAPPVQQMNSSDTNTNNRDSEPSDANGGTGHTNLEMQAL